LSTAAHAPIPPPGHGIEKRGAGVARAYDLPRSNFDQMGMFSSQFQTAQLATFCGAPGARKLAQGSEGLIHGR
jgi:hypothetical protein